jgi:hypothetical protein
MSLTVNTKNTNDVKKRESVHVWPMILPCTWWLVAFVMMCVPFVSGYVAVIIDANTKGRIWITNDGSQTWLNPITANNAFFDVRPSKSLMSHSVGPRLNDFFPACMHMPKYTQVHLVDIYRGAAVGQFGNFIQYRRNMSGLNPLLIDWKNASNMILYPGNIEHSVMYEVPLADGTTSLLPYAKAKTDVFGMSAFPAKSSKLPIFIPDNKDILMSVMPSEPPVTSLVVDVGGWGWGWLGGCLMFT